MEHTKETYNNYECECKNHYTETTFFESFGGDNDSEMKNCNSCPNLSYDCGTMICKKFNKN